MPHLPIRHHHRPARRPFRFQPQPLSEPRRGVPTSSKPAFCPDNPISEPAVDALLVGGHTIALSHDRAKGLVVTFARDQNGAEVSSPRLPGDGPASASDLRRRRSQVVSVQGEEDLAPAPQELLLSFHGRCPCARGAASQTPPIRAAKD